MFKEGLIQSSNKASVLLYSTTYLLQRTLPENLTVAAPATLSFSARRNVWNLEGWIASASVFFLFLNQKKGQFNCLLAMAKETQIWLNVGLTCTLLRVFIHVLWSQFRQLLPNPMNLIFSCNMGFDNWETNPQEPGNIQFILSFAWRQDKAYIPASRVWRSNRYFFFIHAHFIFYHILPNRVFK